MKLYFVRHGETKYNALRQVYGEGAKLTHNGEKQARVVAQRFTHIPIDGIISSPLERAKKTAEIITSVIKKEIQYSELLIENKPPSEFIGIHVEDPKWVEMTRLRREHAHDPAWHYSDEENFFEMRARAMQFIASLSDITYGSILIVTHTNFLRMIIVAMMLKEEYNPDLYYKFRNFFIMDNAGITVCERREDGEFKLLTWNDSAHLGELS